MLDQAITKRFDPAARIARCGRRSVTAVLRAAGYSDAEAAQLQTRFGPEVALKRARLNWRHPYQAGISLESDYPRLGKRLRGIAAEWSVNHSGVRL